METMGMNHEINGNNYYLSQTSPQMSRHTTNCGETLLLSQGSVQAVPQLINGLEMHSNSLNAFNTTFNALDLNQSVIINSNDVSPQQILLVSSPMDLMAVPQTPQPLIPKQVPHSSGGLQMVLQTNNLPLISQQNQMNVIEVPTNLLLTDNNLIVIPPEGMTLEVPSHQTIDNQYNYESSGQTAIVLNGSPQMLATAQQITYDPNVEQLVVNLNDCYAINAINKSLDNSLNANQYFPANQQIIGIIDGNTSEPKLLTADENLSAEDLNAFLANNMVSTVEQEIDANEAKSWLNDSLIAYRAMIAFKKVMPNETPSPTSGCRLQK